MILLDLPFSDPVYLVPEKFIYVVFLQQIFFESLRVQFSAPWGEGWLEASRLKIEVNTPWLAVGVLY